MGDEVERFTLVVPVGAGGDFEISDGWLRWPCRRDQLEALREQINAALDGLEPVEDVVVRGQG